MRKNICSLLVAEGIQVIEAKRLEQVLGKFSLYLPSVVILNNNSDTAESLKVCRQIKNNTLAPDTTVMMLTSCNDNKCIQDMYEYGANDFIHKPFKLPVLFQRLKQMLLTTQLVQKSKAQLNYLAHHDALTGLVNRQFFTKQLERSLNRTHKTGQQSAVLLLDIDNFKRINDTLGNNYGDKLLQKISKRLKLGLRTTDLLMREQGSSEKSSQKIARLGGNEFTIFIENISSIDATIALAKRNIESISLPIVIDDHEVVVTPSIGLAIYPQDGEDVDTLLMNAKKSMRLAKESGGNSFKHYKEEMSELAKKRLKLEVDLGSAIQRGQLELYYQPQVEVKTGKVKSLEALIRWNHPELGIIGPDKFIPIAEETGLIIPIGDWVLKTACLQANQWLKKGLELSRVAVNVSALQFHKGDFFEKVVKSNYCDGGTIAT